jgi:hypothetical protein
MRVAIFFLLLLYTTAAQCNDGLPDRERADMYASCSMLRNHPRFKQLCEDAVKNQNLSGNAKRGCFRAYRLSRTGEDRIEEAKALSACSVGLIKAGYPFKEFLAVFGH